MEFIDLKSQQKRIREILDRRERAWREGIRPLLARIAAEILGPAGWKVDIVESHHDRKKDAPSGTALAIAAALALFALWVVPVAILGGEPSAKVGWLWAALFFAMPAFAQDSEPAVEADAGNDIIVSARRVEPRQVEVSIADRGQGLSDGACQTKQWTIWESRIFR